MTLIDLASKEKEWVKICKYFGADSEISKDLVQEMYLKVAEIQHREGNLQRLENYYGEINTIYIFKILQNLYYDYCKQSKQVVINDVESNEEQNHGDVENLFTQTLLSVQSVISKMDEYEQMMVEMYFVKGISLRKIHKETGIGVHSIFNTIKNAREKIKAVSQTQYKEYKRERDNRETFRWIRRYNREGD